MSTLKFEEDKIATRRGRFTSRSLLGEKQTPFLVKLLIRLKIAGSEKMAYLILLGIAIIFFILSGALFLMASDFNFNHPQPSSSNPPQTPE